MPVTAQVASFLFVREDKSDDISCLVKKPNNEVRLLTLYCNQQRRGEMTCGFGTGHGSQGRNGGFGGWPSSAEPDCVRQQ